MSMRVAIYGCDLQKIVSLFGSKRKEIIKPLQDKLRQQITEGQCLSAREKEFHFVSGANVITRAVLEGIPFIGLEQESDVYNTIAQLFTEMEQQPEVTNFNDWKSVVFDDFGDEYSNKLPKRSQAYLHYFQEGRPLFGKISSNEGRYYGYLIKQEVSFLLDDLVEFQEQESGLPKSPFSEFIDAWIGALDELTIAEKDLWFQAE